MLEAELGVRQSLRPAACTARGSSSSADVGESTNILLRKAAEQCRGKEGTFPARGRG